MSPTALAERTVVGTRTAAQGLRSFYSRPMAWGGALFVSATLSYLGGAVMFWLHAIYRMEGGPDISNVEHWLLDSTLGFVALTPVVFLLLPGVLASMRALVTGEGGLKLATYVVIVGVLFALVTGPGPLLHDTIVGRGTFLANLATDLFGPDPQPQPSVPRSAFTEGLLQVGVGIPVYSLLTWASVAAVRVTGSWRGRNRRTPSTAAS